MCNGQVKGVRNHTKQADKGFQGLYILNKTEKSTFFGEEQKALWKELVKDPRSFWSHLGDKPLVRLCQEDLMKWVRSFYCVPGVPSMPVLRLREEMFFSEEQVERQLRRMIGGKASDIEGWSVKKVVPIFKGGSKLEAYNYMTIMVGSVFAKVLGGLLEERILEWAETHNLCARSQAGLRKGLSTLNHALVLKVASEGT
ncbi:hypothetical protein R1flu_005384 [Riccia fluitans]|uniref:Uncharacterized protein n=1 Tax=Riccia fluitans TaxID=41844 RepID=A0ABD1YT11_9MARC